MVYFSETISLNPNLTDRIPNEIYHHIISSLRSDRRALSTCTLVSTSWLSSARHHLCTSARITRYFKAQRFLDIITAPCQLNTLGPVIRNLSIYSSARVDPAVYIRQLPGLERVYVSASTRFFRTSVGECLRMEEWAGWFRPCSARLTDMALGHTVLGALSEFVEVLREFKALRHLALIEVKWLDPSLPQDDLGSCTTFPDIESFILTGQSTRLIPYLYVRGVIGISRLDLRVAELQSDEALSREKEDIDRYTCLLGHNIEELDLHDGSYKVDSDIPVHLPNLHKLYLHGVDLTMEDSWTVDIIERLATPHLHTLTLDVYLDNLISQSPSANIHGRNAIQRAVASNPQLAMLQGVSLRWLPGDYRGDLDTEKMDMRRFVELHGIASDLSTNEKLPCGSTLEPYRVYERWFDRQARSS